MIRIYGCSDDLVEIEAGDKSDEIGCYDKPVTIALTDAAGHGARFVVQYGVGDKGVWRIGIEPLDEDVPMPWPISVKLGGRGYSAQAEIAADPSAVTITHDGATDEP